MIIKSMTATFGKLENATLELQPGLNVIAAPNEWGKSTWCAFLEAMLYGIDTRSRSTKTTLSEKEHFQPWSGRPMEGRIDLIHNGRSITIQRRTAGRVPLGSFAAFETETGLPIPELTAENCGIQLLGVERSVYRRTGFIRLEELPVTEDEARMFAVLANQTESQASVTSPASASGSCNVTPRRPPNVTAPAVSAADSILTPLSNFTAGHP